MVNLERGAPTPYLQKRESEGYAVYDITCDPHKKWDVAILDIIDTEYHVHKVGHEHFTVLTGMLEIWTDDKTQTLSPGQSIDIFPGVVHKLKSARDEPVRVICTCFPAFDPNDLYVVHKD